jgi:hypothetical protein
MASWRRTSRSGWDNPAPETGPCAQPARTAWEASETGFFREPSPGHGATIHTAMAIASLICDFPAYPFFLWSFRLTRRLTAFPLAFARASTAGRLTYSLAVLSPGIHCSGCNPLKPGGFAAPRGWSRWFASDKPPRLWYSKQIDVPDSDDPPATSSKLRAIKLRATGRQQTLAGRHRCPIPSLSTGKPASLDPDTDRHPHLPEVSPLRLKPCEAVPFKDSRRRT